jgi:UDP-3-O-[3-hydroxymyristoyl] glucosamine N-acyltransferase
MIHPVTISITSEHIKNGKYVGPYDLGNIEGHLEFAADLGVVVVDGDIAASKSIHAKDGTGIEAGGSIKAGGGIEAGWSIKAGTGIKASKGVKAGGGINAGEGIEAGWSIEAGGGIEAGWSIKAGTGIKAGWSIEAGTGIKAGWSIEAGLTIKSKWISTSLRIFAGLVSWRLPAPDEEEIHAEIRRGTVACGRVIAPSDPGSL